MQHQWKPKRAYQQNNVGILGFGELGKACAKRLIANNFTVNAWAHTHKTSNTVNLFYGEQGLQNMLSNINNNSMIRKHTNCTFIDNTFRFFG